MTHRRFQFRLRTLVIALPILAALLSLLRREMVGRVELPQGINFSTGSSQVTLIYVTASDAQAIAERFDESAQIDICRAAERRLSRDPEYDLLVPFDYNFILVRAPAFRWIAVKYDVARWERRHFDLWQLRYVSTASDPVAKRRNGALERAVRESIVEWAREQRPAPLLVDLSP